MKLSFFVNANFICSGLLIVLSIISFQFKKDKIALGILFLGALFIGVFVAKLDPFINLWDEQFHALVAKNFISHPFKPILIEEPIFKINHPHWTNVNIWLHKQPLFLWQMALSIKLFGETELGVRFPSVLMHALMVFFIFRIGVCFVSRKVGFYAALFFTCSYFPLEYLTGFYATDHNDTAFLFYAFASIWALVEYYESKKVTFLILIGLFSGAAILCKWLIGLLVYAIWFILICYNRKQTNIFKEIINLIGSFVICLVVFLPWQIYAYTHYPNEYLAEMAFNTKHILEPLEGHGGNYFYYYTALYEQFGEGLMIPPLLLFCFLCMIFLMQSKNHKIMLIALVTIVYLFFSFVKTKMYGYVFIAFPFFIVGLAFIINVIIDKIKDRITNNYFKKISQFSILVLMVIFLFNAGKLYKHHSNLEYGRYKSRLVEIREKQLFLSLKEKFKDENYLIFNCNTSLQSHLLAIFYTNYPAFNYTLSQEQLAIAKKLKYKLIALDDGTLPEYILGDKSILKLKFGLRP